MADSTDLFDNDMIETTLMNYNPMKGLKNKIPWVDKHRPKKLDEIVQQEEVIKVLKESLKTGDFPHMLFYGSSGTGKTSTILSFAMELYGPKIFNQRVIELNASDERGINVVRNKIITFAKTAIGNADPDYPCPPYKIIILDEADAMTMEAQSALRTVMESLSGITRFCFICNYINQIIDPIASRCMKFRFKSIDTSTMINKLTNISKKEGFPIGDDVIEKIVELSKGDIRCGIITLQYLKYIYDYQGSISLNDIYETTNYLPMNVIKEVWDRCIEKKNTMIKDVKKETLLLKQKGYGINAILDKLNKIVIDCKKLNDSQKALIVFNIATAEKCLIDGANEYIQLFNVMAYIHGVYNKKITCETN